MKKNLILATLLAGLFLPALAQGKMTPEEFAAREDESIRMFEEEQ